MQFIGYNYSFPFQLEFDKELSELERKVEAAARKIEGTEKLTISEVVAVFVPDWHKYIRAAIKRKHDDEYYCIWAVDYGVPMLSHVSDISKLPRSFTGMQLKNKRIHLGGIENCLPAQTTFDIDTGGVVKEKLSNWSPGAIELTQKLINQAIKLEFEHVEDLAENRRSHYFGRLMIQRQDGQMVNVLLCLLEMSMAKLVEGSFKEEIITIDSLSQTIYMSINGDTLDTKLCVAPVLCVKNDTGFTDAEIYGDDDDDELSDNETAKDDFSIEEFNEFFNESASMLRPNMQLHTDDSTEILSTIIENAVSPQTSAKSTDESMPINDSHQKPSEKNSRNDELRRTNQRRRNGRDRDRNRNRRPKDDCPSAPNHNNQQKVPPNNQQNNQRNNNQNNFVSNSGHFDGRRSVNQRLNNQNDTLQRNFGLTEFEQFCGRRKFDNIPIGHHTQSSLHPNQFGPQPRWLQVQPPNNNRAPFVMPPPTPQPSFFQGMFGNGQPPHVNSNRHFGERPRDNYMPVNNSRYPNVKSSPFNGSNMHPKQDKNLQKNDRQNPSSKSEVEQHQQIVEENGTKENIPTDVRADEIKEKDRATNPPSSTCSTPTN